MPPTWSLLLNWVNSYIECSRVRVRRITTFFHRTTNANHQLEEKQKLVLPCHKLKTDVSCRWNSAYEMVDRLLEQQPAICATLLSPQVRKGEADLTATSLEVIVPFYFMLQLM
ncbi:hypothetical protein N1851_013926 [Merluccius polli]|uniref:Uncharacterized protein n=1 Tax=Merluccius polli TaxID=89951 RepID=A0AA47P3V7_MERPO|nr:hypothetical protein N1851_013926 [Merluccius polli]